MTDAMTDDMVIERNPSILFNDFDEGLMMMDIDSGHYFDIDQVGGRIWTLLESPSTLGRICESLVQEFDVDPETCRSDTAGFIGELVANGLITVKPPK